MSAMYVWSDELINESDRLPAVPGRATKVHELITAYGLLEHMQVIRSVPATYNQLREFHSEIYLDHLKKITDIDEDEYMATCQDEEYGLGYDCAPVSHMFELVSAIAGGSITAARCLVLGLTNVAINWCGGWHHAHRFGAEGHCYINDIVLAIEFLRKKFRKVLYIDFDVHHGNGVEDAYNLSKTVLTLSFHKQEPGFYPGSGKLEDIGQHTGKGFSCNFPLKDLYSDETFVYSFKGVFDHVYNAFSPDAIVVQCGADALAGDPNGGCNLSIGGYTECLRRVLDKRKPTLLLGGGGYNHANTARLWASATAAAVGVTLDEEIPEHEHWPDYGPHYGLTVTPRLRRDSNKKEYLDYCIQVIHIHTDKYLTKPNEDSKTTGDHTEDTELMNIDNSLLENTTDYEPAWKRTKYNEDIPDDKECEFESDDLVFIEPQAKRIKLNSKPASESLEILAASLKTNLH